MTSRSPLPLGGGSIIAACDAERAKGPLPLFAQGLTPASAAAGDRPAFATGPVVGGGKPQGSPLHP